MRDGHEFGVVDDVCCFPCILVEMLGCVEEKIGSAIDSAESDVSKIPQEAGSDGTEVVLSIVDRVNHP